MLKLILICNEPSLQMSLLIYSICIAIGRGKVYEGY